MKSFLHGKVVFRSVVSQSQSCQCRANIIRTRTPVITTNFPSLSYSTNSTPAKHERSLLDLHEAGIYKASDIKVVTERAIQKIQFIRYALRCHVDGSHPLPSTTRCLELLDAVSNELCLAIDSAEFIRNAHEDVAFQQAASESFTALSSLIADLNADRNLYNILKEIIEDKASFSLLPVSDQQVALDLLRDFKLEGIHLSDEHRQKLQQMNHDVSELESQWSQNILHSGTPDKEIETTEEFDRFYATLGPFPKKDKDNFQQLSRWISRQLTQPSDAAQAQILVMPRDQRVMGMVMASVHNAELREKLWWEYSITPQANIATLPVLLHRRHQLADFLGYRHYAEKTLLKNVAKDTQSVRALIQVLSQAARPYAQEVLSLFRARKYYLQTHGHSTTGSITAGISKLFSSSSSSSSDHVKEVPLYPWDIAYLQHQSIPTHLLSLPTTNAHKNDTNSAANSWRKNAMIDADEQARAVQRIKEYFPIHRCVEGLALVTESLFGVTMRQDDIHPHETWLQSEEDSRHGIMKFHLFDKKLDGRKHSSSSLDNQNAAAAEERHLGTIYVDLFRRPHKFPGAAHFTVRCGCTTVTYPHQNHAHNNPSYSYSQNAQTMAYQANLWQTKTQTPIVALVFPFQSQQASSSSSSSNHHRRDHTGMFSSSSSHATCLSLSEVETLFHEWGHALHSVLSQSKYQHHSGTRGSTDFIEIPSHLFEHFARDASVIQQWAKHHQTNERIPAHLLATALSSKSLYQGLDLQVQIALSLADQYLLSEDHVSAFIRQNNNNINSRSKIHEDPRTWSEAEQRLFYLQTMNGIAALQAEFTDLPLANVQDTTQAPAWFYTSQTNNSNSNDRMMPYVSMLAHRHFVGYAGSYHSYLFAKVVAAQIWESLFATNTNVKTDTVLSREMGQHLRRALLSWGSSQPPEHMLHKVLSYHDLHPHTTTTTTTTTAAAAVHTDHFQANKGVFKVDPEPYLRMMMKGTIS